MLCLPNQKCFYFNIVKHITNDFRKTCWGIKSLDRYYSFLSISWFFFSICFVFSQDFKDTANVKHFLKVKGYIKGNWSWQFILSETEQYQEKEPWKYIKFMISDSRGAVYTRKALCRKGFPITQPIVSNWQEILLAHQSL